MTYREVSYLPTTDKGMGDAECPGKHRRGWTCTRIDGHGGLHEAGIDNRYVAEWDDEDEGAYCEAR